MKDYSLNDLVKDYGNYIRTIISNSSKDLTNEDQEEILEDTLFNVYRKLDKIDENILKGYISKTTKNLVINKLKQNKKYDADSLNLMKDENDFELEDQMSDIENIIISNDKIVLIKNIINDFNDIDKKIFLDYYFSNKKINDISKENNISKTNVKVKLHRARNTIKNQLLKGGYNYD